MSEKYTDEERRFWEQMVITLSGQVTKWHSKEGLSIPDMADRALKEWRKRFGDAGKE